jgi:hypothetical protein
MGGWSASVAKEGAGSGRRAIAAQRIPEVHWADLEIGQSVAGEPNEVDGAIEGK